MHYAIEEHIEALSADKAAAERKRVECESALPAKTAIHGGFSLPTIEPYQQ
ncbi:MAG: hypothetical protein ACLPV8_28105 [Steroidobacteraceae bacterium]